MKKMYGKLLIILLIFTYVFSWFPTKAEPIVSLIYFGDGLENYSGKGFYADLFFNLNKAAKAHPEIKIRPFNLYIKFWFSSRSGYFSYMVFSRNRKNAGNYFNKCYC